MGNKLSSSPEEAFPPLFGQACKFEAVINERARTILTSSYQWQHLFRIRTKRCSEKTTQFVFEYGYAGSEREGAETKPDASLWKHYSLQGPTLQIYLMMSALHADTTLHITSVDWQLTSMFKIFM